MAEHARFEKLVAEAKQKITEISATEAAEKLKSGEALIVDVREKDEWDEEHIPTPNAFGAESWHDRVGDRGKSSRRQRNDHLPLRRRRPIRARRREPAKNGLQKRALNGGRLQSLEGRWVAGDEVPPRYERLISCLTLTALIGHKSWLHA
jgi:rhodanese-related sulfurtransferase